MKKILIFISVVFLSFFALKIKTYAVESEEYITYNMYLEKDIMIFSLFNSGGLNNDNLANEGILMWFGQELLSYKYYSYNGLYNLNYIPSDHIINSYLAKNPFCYYIKCTNIEYFEYTMFIFSIDSYYNDLATWQQIGRFDFSLGSEINILKMSNYTTNLVYYLNPNNDIKLTLVRNAWADLSLNDNNVLGNIINGGDLDPYENGYNSGYADGYAQGEENIENLPISFLNPILSFFTTFFTIKLAPGLTIGSIVLIPLILGIIGLVLYFWRKD